MAENDTDRNEPCDPDIDDTAAAPAYRMSRGRVALLAVLALLTALFSLFAPEGLTGLSIAFAGACCAALAGCVVWFWAAFRYGLDKRVLLRVMMMVGGLFVLNMTVMAFLSLLRL